ncbi:MAG: hypothetical protein WKG07_47295 [Hymenobacter sp.]
MPAALRFLVGKRVVSTVQMTKIAAPAAPERGFQWGQLRWLALLRS